MLIDNIFYTAPTSSLWQGRQDSLPEERFFQRVECIDLCTQPLNLSTKQTLILGFCSDEGIRRNTGRPGAKEGPDSLRVQLGKLACHSANYLLDLGNIICPNEQLERAQETLAQLLNVCHQNPVHTVFPKTLVLGGGHEMAWGHFRGLSAYYPRLGIINFDAHFDLRPPKAEHYGTSGTPFWQIHAYCQQQGLPFDYCCLGIQPYANTKSLLNIANNSGVSYLTAEDIQKKNLDQQYEFLDNFIHHHEYLYLTLCLDVFAECFAPGVSARQATGLTPWQVLPLLKYIIQTGKVVSLDIAELSPPLDQENQTARLAATMLAELLNLN